MSLFGDRISGTPTSSRHTRSSYPADPADRPGVDHRARGYSCVIQAGETGAWFAHAKGHKFWLDRLEVHTDDGEIVDCILDAYTHIEVVEPADDETS